MLKKNTTKEKNKDKKVHFDVTQVPTDMKSYRAKSAGKKKDASDPMKTDIKKNMSNSLSTTSIQKKTTIEDFTIIQELGSGSYAKVILAKHKLNGKSYAVKKMNKNMLNNFDKQHEVHIEKQILAELNHPNIVKLNKTFQDKKHLYFVLEYCQNKDLGKLIKCLGKFSFKLAQFYLAEIFTAIAYMHKRGIYHRDLKPENIGLDEEMHLKLFDFATAVKVNKFFDLRKMRFIDLDEESIDSINEHKRDLQYLEENNNIITIDNYKILLLSHLFVGTPEYVSPEVLTHNYKLIGPSVDIWAFGIMIYLFFTGVTPFKAKTEKETLENIKNVKYSFNDENAKDIPEEARDLISKILVKEPSKRIGYNSRDYKDIKNHPFFKGIIFEDLEWTTPPFEDIKDKLEKFGYVLPKIDDEKNIINDIYEDKNNNDDNIDNNNSNAALRLSAKNIEKIKISVKGNTFEHKAMEDNFNEKKGEDNDEEDSVVLEEILFKKSPWLHYNNRLVRLYSKGHIDYFEPKTKQFKGSFVINSNCKANFIDDYRFEIVTINRNYFFKNKNKKIANEWVEKINYFIDKDKNK